MADASGRFEQQQAVFGLLAVDARLSRLGLLSREDLVNAPLDDPGVIVARIQGAQVRV